MICLKCGKQIADSTKFCPYCGTATSSGGPDAPGVPPVPGAVPAGASPLNVAQVSKSGKKGGGKGLIAGAVAAVAAVALLVVAAFASGLFASPKSTVEKSLAKTAAAYAEAAQAMGAPDLGKLAEDRSVSQTLSLAVNSISPELSYEDLSFLEGMGLRLGADYDQKGRKLDAELTCFYHEADLASLQMLVDNNKMLFASKEFTKSSAYGWDTTTLGADLCKLGAQDDTIDIEKISFNLFDLIEKVVPAGEQTRQTRQALNEARKALLESIEVEKGGKQSVRVNGKSVDAALFRVKIPEDALKDFVRAVEPAMKKTDVKAVMEDVLQSVGFEEDVVDEMLAGMDGADASGELADALDELRKALGDVELDVYINNGYVRAAEYSGRIEDSKVELGLYLGGGENFVDDLSLELSVDDGKLSLSSSGSHSGKKGVFTDKTVFKVDSNRVTSELRYEPKAGSNNFEWELRVDNTASVTMQGQLSTTKDSLDLELNDVSLKAAGSEAISLKAGYTLGPCKGMRVSMSSPTLLGDMTQEDLMALVQETGSNAEDWAYDVLDKLPAGLLGLLY